jgi:hypothetical protein
MGNDAEVAQLGKIARHKGIRGQGPGVSETRIRAWVDDHIVIIRNEERSGVREYLLPDP